VATKQTVQDKQDANFELIMGGIVSLWFDGAIKDRLSSEKFFDLKPHAAICLAIMASKSVASSLAIANQLRFRLKLFDKVEDLVIVEYGMLSLQDAGFVSLDAAGKKEFSIAIASGSYGLEGVHWTLTAAGAKRAAPFYCGQTGHPPQYQKTAVAEILAANKIAVKAGREMGKVEIKELPTVPRKPKKALVAESETAIAWGSKLSRVRQASKIATAATTAEQASAKAAKLAAKTPVKLVATKIARKAK
jgi:hypothetical protein